MASEERKIRALRDAQRREENKRCADCTERLPNYIVTDFNIFVCTACSGIHREFSHRVKSVTLAIFSDDEVRAVRKGGNKIANDLYMAKQDSLRGLLEPDDNNVEKRRDFIRAKYVEKRWYATAEDLTRETEEKKRQEIEKVHSSNAKINRRKVPVVQPLPRALSRDASIHVKQKETVIPFKEKATDLLSLSPTARGMLPAHSFPASGLSHQKVLIPPPPGPAMQNSFYQQQAPLQQSSSLMDMFPTENIKATSPFSQPHDVISSSDNIWADFVSSTPQKEPENLLVSNNGNQALYQNQPQNHIANNMTPNAQVMSSFPQSTPHPDMYNMLNGYGYNAQNPYANPALALQPLHFQPSVFNSQPITAYNIQVPESQLPAPVSVNGVTNVSFQMKNDPFAEISQSAPYQPFKKGERVEYHKNGQSESATIIKVHDDAPNPPFYTIQLLSSGQERNTDHLHLKPELVQKSAQKSDPFQFADPFSMMKMSSGLENVSYKELNPKNVGNQGGSLHIVPPQIGNPFDLF